MSTRPTNYKEKHITKMIESRYWKEELSRIAKTIKPLRKPRQWSERACCVVERDLMIGFFIIRRLIELNKVSSRTRDFSMKVYSCPTRKIKITRLDGHWIPDGYDLENEKTETKKPTYISNQFIHAYTSFVLRDETRNWSDVYVISNFDRNDCIWRIPISVIRELFELASDDYPSRLEYVFDPSKGDYIVTTDQENRITG